VLSEVSAEDLVRFGISFVCSFMIGVRKNFCQRVRGLSFGQMHVLKTQTIVRESTPVLRSDSLNLFRALELRAETYIAHVSQDHAQCSRLLLLVQYPARKRPPTDSQGFGTRGESFQPPQTKQSRFGSPALFNSDDGLVALDHGVLELSGRRNRFTARNIALRLTGGRPDGTGIRLFL
jgi:hypothetical protein